MCRATSEQNPSGIIFSAACGRCPFVAALRRCSCLWSEAIRHTGTRLPSTSPLLRTMVHHLPAPLKSVKNRVFEGL